MNSSQTQKAVELTDLPVEVLQHITKRVTITKDILSFAATCTTAASVYCNTWQPTVHTLCQRHWNNTAPIAPPTADPALVRNPQRLLDWRQQAEINLRNCNPVREWEVEDEDLLGTFFVRINRQHQRVVAASSTRDDEVDGKDGISIWDINGQKLHYKEMSLHWDHCAFDAAFDAVAVVDDKGRFGVVDMDTCQFVWRNNMAWLPEIVEGPQDEEPKDPYGSTQILNNKLFLTSHPSTKGIVLHDARMQPHSCALRFTTPVDLEFAYAMHEGTRTTPVPSANDISCIAAYCTQHHPLFHHAIRTYDARMVGDHGAQLLDRCRVQGGRAYKGVCSMDTNGRFLLVHLASQYLRPRTYSLQVWDLLRPLGQGPLASTVADEGQGGFIATMTDDARNVVMGSHKLGIWALTPGAGEAAQGEQAALEFRGEYEPSMYSQDADFADTLLVCGGEDGLTFASFGELFG